MSNEDIKMSDVFDLPVQSGADGCVYDLHYSRICTSGSNSKEIAHVINNHDPMALRIKELEEALGKIKDITGELGGQNPANFCEELAMEQDDATYRVYKLSNIALSKALEQSK
tara:strand:- start:2778 stop:3116 length:339 start_codon:yes stop_codon:yes gene_type:complete